MSKLHIKAYSDGIFTLGLFLVGLLLGDPELATVPGSYV